MTPYGEVTVKNERAVTLYFSRAKIAGLIVEIRIGQTGARIAMTDIDIDGLKDQNSRTLFFFAVRR